MGKKIEPAGNTELSISYGLKQASSGLTAYPKTLKSGQVEAVKIHHLVPCVDKVMHELLLGVCGCVDFSERP